jgi:uncharacterized protein
MKTLTLTAVLGLLAVPASATSFDCHKARTPTERVVCSYPKIGALDEQVSGLYLELHSACVGDPQQATTILNEQHDFLILRNACGSNAGCLVGRYNDRVTDLNNALGEEPCEGTNAAMAADPAAQPSAPQQGVSYELGVIGVDPWDPDPYLALRSKPTTQDGQRLSKMRNGTVVAILEKQEDGWWFVQDLKANIQGWAKSGAGWGGLERSWIKVRDNSVVSSTCVKLMNSAGEVTYQCP